MTVELRPWARDKMKPDDKAEVYAYARAAGAKVVMGYNPKQRRFYAEVGGTVCTNPLEPMAAFRAAVTQRELPAIIGINRPDAA